MSNKRGGCAGVVSFLLLLCLITAVYAWPRYLDSVGLATTGKLTDKRETIRVQYGDWFRHFEIVANYSTAGQRTEHRASCAVDEQTYDSLHIGDAVTVHYLTDLLSQPFIPATHLAPCTSFGALNQNPELMQTLLVALVALMTILLLWKVFRIRLAGWLLVPWFAVLFVKIAIPEAEPAPRELRQGEAMVQAIDKVTKLLETNDDEGLPLQHAYQIVQLKFIPEGRDWPVIAVDKIDLGSMANLRVGYTNDIVYDATRPRLARLHGGTREFPAMARWTVIWIACAFVCLVFAVGTLGWFFRLIFRNPVARAARAKAVIGRHRRRRF